MLSVLRHSDLSPAAVRVAMVCGLKYMNWNTLYDCRPGNVRLAADTGYNLRTVRRALAELVEAGFLVKAHKGGTRRGVRVATTYRGTFPRHGMP